MRSRNAAGHFITALDPGHILDSSHAQLPLRGIVHLLPESAGKASTRFGS
jgi:hypothetical protein